MQSAMAEGTTPEMAFPQSSKVVKLGKRDIDGDISPDKEIFGREMPITWPESMSQWMPVNSQEDRSSLQLSR